MPNHQSGKRIIVAILGLAINKDKQFLLTRREAPNRPPWHNKWQLPGGALEFGETPEQALARELEEELQVSARILHPQPILKTYVWYGHETDEKRDSHLVLVAYLVDIKDQHPNTDNDHETNAYQWLTFEKALTLDSLPMTREIVDEAYKICNQCGLWGMVE